ncbi:tRNA pseudouridine synthase [Schizosaccharomyces cryophilus OY26]|uniref:tRNA pseudouridine(55) synthase n=1 Tax=Schizosaccharomyces cryophilus (strain OY26 / ATCC MYA-4695 / CBS 11777 / NBRC 106824 / NRRL Y48691) TaxID=653667 RepID=S9X9L8_SCHCR|nr:tRNA pseudouridine synthase [Schizosaccharomyces cryophilus OY26]EPY50446.1 tRNA pseudouridine synthase [Schizosaccharomyces cryophilus OY26]
MKGGLVAINKPSGKSSAQCLNEIKAIISRSELAKFFQPDPPHPNDKNSKRKKWKRNDIKIGHGGTLDPLASGVLVVGLGIGTKQLPTLLSCVKTYKATCLFGCSTNTYDSSGKIIRVATKIPSKEEIADGLAAFRGDILQLPPLYSALHIQGKRLYEYAREGLPLPENVKPRPMRCDHLELIDFHEKGQHNYNDPDTFASKEEIESEELLRPVPDSEKKKAENDSDGAVNHDSVQDNNENSQQKSSNEEASAVKSTSVESIRTTEEKEGQENKNEPKNRKRKLEVTDLERGSRPAIGPSAVLDMSVSSGFYVRSVIHDLAHHIGSEAHMVDLIRTQQGDFVLGSDACFEFEEFHSAGWEQKLASLLKLDLENKEG